MYQFNENFVLPLSHGGLVSAALFNACLEIGGDSLAGMGFGASSDVRALNQLAGNEIAQFIEWRYYEGIGYYLTEGIQLTLTKQAFIKALNHFYKNHQDFGVCLRQPWLIS